MEWFIKILLSIFSKEQKRYEEKTEQLRKALSELENGTEPLIRIENDEKLLEKAKEYIRKFKNESGARLKTSLFPLIETLISEMEKERGEIWYKVYKKQNRVSTKNYVIWAFIIGFVIWLYQSNNRPILTDDQAKIINSLNLEFRDNKKTWDNNYIVLTQDAGGMQQSEI